MKASQPVARFFAQPSWNLAQPGMAEVIRRQVKDQHVLDIGGSDGMLAQYLIEVCGARHVTVVEKERQLEVLRAKEPLRGVDFFWGYLDAFNKHRVFGEMKWSVAVCSWPINNDQFCRSAIETMRRCGRVVIIGCNDGVNACGTSCLWEYLVQRERTDMFIHPRNDIVVYGINERPECQPLLPIEEFGLSYDLGYTPKIKNA